MLKDRLDTAIALYKKGAAPKLLLSGDNSVPEYSEPDSMYRYALSQGVADEDIFLDFAGFSTYDSVYRARDVFCAERMIIVTQKYHLFRALKIADALGIEAKGVSQSSDPKSNGRGVISLCADEIVVATSATPTSVTETVRSETLTVVTGLDFVNDGQGNTSLEMTTRTLTYRMGLLMSIGQEQTSIVS
jgi:vancomycin permeability regulator SanA